MIAKKLFVFPLIALAFALGFVGCKKSDFGPPGGQKYHCPMHPTYVSDKPGDCPICGMKLVLIKEDKPKSASTSAPSKEMAQAEIEKTAHIKPGQFYCPMHPEVVQDKPGKCPKCGMSLVEKKEAPAGHEGHATGTSAAPVPGRISVSLSADKRQMIGLALSKVEKRSLTNTVRTTAVVQHDETRYARIAPRFGGWVRKLHVNSTGAPVEKGQPLFTVYSPELFSTENEYLIAWRAVQQVKADAPPGPGGTPPAAGCSCGRLVMTKSARSNSAVRPVMNCPSGPRLRAMSWPRRRSRASLSWRASPFTTSPTCRTCGWMPGFSSLICP